MSIAQKLEQRAWNGGLEQGLEQVAMNLLSAGVEITLIAKVTKLSLDKIKALKEKQH